jgi:hypothetical protein
LEEISGMEEAVEGEGAAAVEGRSDEGGSTVVLATGVGVAAGGASLADFALASFWRAACWAM